MEEKVELLACPFCGGEANTNCSILEYGDNNFFFAVGCSKCDIIGQRWDTKEELEEAIEHWNTRAEVTNEKL